MTSCQCLFYSYKMRAVNSEKCFTIKCKNKIDENIYIWDNLLLVQDVVKEHPPFF